MGLVRRAVTGRGDIAGRESPQAEADHEGSDATIALMTGVPAVYHPPGVM
jgi:hypothetical protein